MLECCSILHKTSIGNNKRDRHRDPHNSALDSDLAFLHYLSRYQIDHYISRWKYLTATTFPPSDQIRRQLVSTLVRTPLLFFITDASKFSLREPNTRVFSLVGEKFGVIKLYEQNHQNLHANLYTKGLVCLVYCIKYIDYRFTKRLNLLITYDYFLSAQLK